MVLPRALGRVRALWHVPKLTWIAMHEGLRDVLSRPGCVVLNVTATDGKSRIARHVGKHEDANIGDRHVRRSIVIRREQI